MTEELRPIKLTINAETGEEIIEPFTDEEWAEQKARAEQARLEWEAQEAAAQAKAEAKASALAKLAALGLTEEEAAALAGN
jgi:hypothetical protein